MYCIVWGLIWFSTPQQALDFVNRLERASERNSAKIQIVGKNATVQYCKSSGNYATMGDRETVIDTRNGLNKD